MTRAVIHGNCLRGWRFQKMHVRVDVATFQNDMKTIKSRDDVLTLLVHLGYLAYDIDRKSVYIPNEEVREEFVRAVTTGRHTELAKLIRNSDHLLEATLNMQVKGDQGGWRWRIGM